MKYSAIILAAGSGTRTGLKTNKILIKIGLKKVIEYSLDFFYEHDYCNQIILVVSKENFNYMLETYSHIVDKVIIGGELRQDSVNNALTFVDNDYVVIHDGARPLIDHDFISFIVGNLQEHSVISTGSAVKDTIHIHENGFVTGLISREDIVAVQTPQCFKTSLIKEAYKTAYKESFYGTDDISLIFRYTTIKPYIYVFTKPNIKFTTIEDKLLLEVILNENR